MVKRIPSYGDCSIRRLLPLTALAAMMVAGCGDSSAGGDSINAFVGNGGQPVLQPTLPVDPSLEAGDPAAVFEDATDDEDQSVISGSIDADLPLEDPSDLDDIGPITTLADTGIRVGFSKGLSADSVDLSVIEASWTRMQSCLSVVAPAPLVIVSDESILPMSGADDILFHLDGTITASSTRFATGVTVQISLDDLDSSFGRIGFNLRSIMGRYLWTSAGLPERDYRHSCAS